MVDLLYRTSVMYQYQLSIIKVLTTIYDFLFALFVSHKINQLSKEKFK